jgi:hypothetical protein
MDRCLRPLLSALTSVGSITLLYSLSLAVVREEIMFISSEQHIGENLLASLSKKLFLYKSTVYAKLMTVRVIAEILSLCECIALILS